MSLVDPVVVWTAAFVATLFTSDPLAGFVHGGVVYYLLLYPMGDALLAATPVDNWNNVTRMFFFILYGSGSAMSCAWLFNTPVLIPAHSVDESTHPVRRKLGVYTLLVSPVTLATNILWLTGAYAPSVAAMADTIGAGPPIEVIYVLISAFALLSTALIVIVHRDTLAGDTASSLAIARYGADPGDSDEGKAIVAYVWLAAALIGSQALWFVDFPLPWVLVLITEALVLTVAYIAIKETVARSITRRHFSKKADGIRWRRFVALLAAATIGVGAFYAALVGTVITTLMDVDWLLWSLFLALTLLAKFLPSNH